MEYPSPLCSEKKKCIYLKPRKISEISNNSISVCDHSVPTRFKWQRRLECRAERGSEAPRALQRVLS